MTESGSFFEAMLKGKLTDRATQVRFFRFLVVGGISTGVQFAALAFGRHSFDPKYIFSLSFACSAATHYVLNRFWALPSSRRDPVRQLGEYMGAIILSYFINLGAFSLCHDGLGLSVMWAAAWAVPPSTVVVFLLLNYRVFRANAGAI